MNIYGHIDLSGLSELIKKVGDRDRFVRGQDGKQIHSSQTAYVLPPYLHQDSERMTQEQSADFERKHPAAFNFILNLQRELSRKLD